jgi:hypothetical protein
MRRLLPAVLLISLTLLGCHKSSRQGPATAPQPAQPATQPPAVPPMGQPPGLNQAQPGQTQRPSPPKPGQSPSISLAQDRQAEPLLSRTRPLSSAATLMALGRQTRTLPEDFKIGPLGDNRTEDQDANAAVSAAEAFLTGVVAGKPDGALLTAESAKTVLDTLTYGLKQGYAPSSFRLGTPKLQDDGEIAANVRLFGADGTAEGEIYLARAGKKWLVSDMQLSLAQLAVKREKAKEKYFPSAYRWLLEE